MPKEDSMSWRQGRVRPILTPYRILVERLACGRLVVRSARRAAFSTTLSDQRSFYWADLVAVAIPTGDATPTALKHAGWQSATDLHLLASGDARRAGHRRVLLNAQMLMNGLFTRLPQPGLEVPPGA
jgi:hypothetical protein